MVKKLRGLILFIFIFATVAFSAQKFIAVIEQGRTTYYRVQDVKSIGIVDTTSIKAGANIVFEKYWTNGILDSLKIIGSAGGGGVDSAEVYALIGDSTFVYDLRIVSDSTRLDSVISELALTNITIDSLGDTLDIIYTLSYQNASDIADLDSDMLDSLLNHINLINANASDIADNTELIERVFILSGFNGSTTLGLPYYVDGSNNLTQATSKIDSLFAKIVGLGTGNVGEIQLYGLMTGLSGLPTEDIFLDSLGNLTDKPDTVDFHYIAFIGKAKSPDSLFLDIQPQFFVYVDTAAGAQTFILKAEVYDSLDAIKEDIDSLESAVDSINTNVSDNATDITNLETAVDTMNPNISDNVGRIDSLSGVAPDTTEFKAEQANIDNLETAVDTMNPNISDNATAISDNATDIGNLETAVDSIDENVSDNAGRIDSLSGVAPDTTEFKAEQANIDNLETAVDSIDENVSDNVARIDSLSGVAPDTTEFKAEQANIDNLETAVDSINPNISDNASDIGNLETAADTINENVGDNVELIEKIFVLSGFNGSTTLGLPYYVDGSNNLTQATSKIDSLFAKIVGLGTGNVGEIQLYGLMIGLSGLPAEDIFLDSLGNLIDKPDTVDFHYIAFIGKAKSPDSLFLDIQPQFFVYVDTAAGAINLITKEEVYDSLADVREDIDSLESAVDTMNPNISDNATNIATNVTDITNLQTEIDSTQEWLDTLNMYMSFKSDSMKVDSNFYVFGKVWIQDSLIVNTRVLFIPPVDSSAVGDIILRQAGENLVYLNSCYLKSDGKYWKTNADAAATMPSRLVALGTISANGWGLFMEKGYLRCDALNLTIGGDIFPGVTPGELTQTQVSGPGNQSQKAGYAENADVIKFQPDWTVLEMK